MLAMLAMLHTGCHRLHQAADALHELQRVCSAWEEDSAPAEPGQSHMGCLRLLLLQELHCSGLNP